MGELMHVYGENDGAELVRAARNAIELYLISRHFDRNVVKKSVSRFNQRHGIFVTLEHYPTKELRGCIGFPRAVAPIGESVVEAAIAAAFEDPRFVPVSNVELDELSVEVSILSNPVPIEGTAKKRKTNIKVGRDGLIVEYGLYSGLLLPIVAVEQRWNEEQFLEEVCVKAGLQANYWSQPNVKLLRFETQVFREETPKGKVIEVKY
jgi:uncharacterized protein (TIGR00296 family)